MSLFSGEVRLRPAEAANLAKIAAAAERGAAALDALVTKISEPDPEPLPDNEAELQAQIDAFTARVQEAKTKLEAKAAQGTSGSA